MLVLLACVASALCLNLGVRPALALHGGPPPVKKQTAKPSSNAPAAASFLLTIHLQTNMNPDYEVQIPVTQGKPFALKTINAGAHNEFSGVLQAPVDGKYTLELDISQEKKDADGSESEQESTGYKLLLGVPDNDNMIRPAVFRQTLTLFALPLPVVHPHYTVTELGMPAPGAFTLRGFNNTGQIVGEAVPEGSSVSQGFAWQAGKVTWLPGLGDTRSNAVALNNHNQIVGTAPSANAGGSAPLQAVEWQEGKPVTLGVEADQESPLAINEVGQFVGTTKRQAFLWDKGKVTLLGMLPEPEPKTHAQARAINSKGQVVGATVDNAPNALTPEQQTARQQLHAWLWEAGKMTDLEVGEALAINDAGQVLIRSWGGARLWQKGKLTPLQALPRFPRRLPCALNNSGQVVGSVTSADGKQVRPVAWEQGKPIDLTEVLPAGTTLELLAINDSGQILGYGQKEGHPCAYLLTPVPAKP